MVETPRNPEEPDARDIPRLLEPGVVEEAEHNVPQGCLRHELAIILNRLSKELRLTAIDIAGVLDSLKYEVFRNAEKREDGEDNDS